MIVEAILDFIQTISINFIIHANVKEHEKKNYIKQLPSR